MHSEYVPNEYTIWWDGKPVSEINRHLLKKQNAEGNLRQILALHVEKLNVYEKIKLTGDKKKLRMYACMITDIEFSLQKKWNFPEDINFHRFWSVPKCVCPALDNNDRYPHGYYVTNAACPLHGDI